jgi:hypothetical protein
VDFIVLVLSATVLVLLLVLVLVLVLDGDERVGWFEKRFSEMMGDE